MQRIGDMPGPDLADARGRDQVDSLLPGQKGRGEAVEPAERFT